MKAGSQEQIKGGQENVKRSMATYEEETTKSISKIQMQLQRITELHNSVGNKPQQ